MTRHKICTALACLAVIGASVAASVVGAASTGAAVLTAPAASYVLASAVAFDGQSAGPTAASRTVTLPALVGLGPDGQRVAYIVTESSNADDAQRLGVNFSPKLANALGTAAVQRATVRKNGSYRFAGTVDFSPRHVLIPGAAPNYFPPTDFAPGAVADPLYSPLVTTGDGIVRNAPHLANASGIADTVTTFNVKASTVTLSLIQGFYEGHSVQYIRTESSDRLVAAVEDSTWAPLLADSPGLASNDPATSAREAIVPIVNGQTGADNPQRQGLNSALAGDGAPLNIIQEEPAAPTDPSSAFYSPVWDVSPAVWSSASMPTQLRDAQLLQPLAQDGTISSAGQGPYNASLGLRASGAVSMCPVIAVLI